MAKLADAIALGAIGATLGGSNPLPPIKFLRSKNFTSSDTLSNYLGLSSGGNALSKFCSWQSLTMQHSALIGIAPVRDR